MQIISRIQHVLMVGLIASTGCSWSVTRLSADTRPQVNPKESIKKLKKIPEDTGVICSQLPVKIIRIDQHDTSAAYRAHRKAIFLVDPGQHSIRVSFGDEWRFPFKPLEGNVDVAGGHAVEIQLETAVPNVADVNGTDESLLWTVQPVVDAPCEMEH